MKMPEIRTMKGSVENLFIEGTFPEKGYTLLQVREVYFQKDSGIRDDVFRNFEKSETFPDIIKTDIVRMLPEGFKRIRYIQKPRAIKVRDRVYLSGGNEIQYDCPKSGYAVPADGHLWHPETGTAIATVNERELAVKMVAEHMERNWEEFSSRDFPGKFHYHKLRKKLGEDIDYENLTPRQLAEIETSYQKSPTALHSYNGPFAVFRRFSIQEHGPFELDLQAPFGHTGGKLHVRIHESCDRL